MQDGPAEHRKLRGRPRLAAGLVAVGALVGLAALSARSGNLSVSSSSARLLRTEYVLPLEPVSFHSRGQLQTRFKIGGEEFVMMVDSASADIAVVMRDCVSCAKHRNKYVPGPNASALGCDAASNGGINCSECVTGLQPNGGEQCGYGVGYADGSSIHTLVFSELIQFGSAPPVRAHVGAVYVESEGFEPAHVDGIFGLGMRGLTSVEKPTALDQLVAAGLIEDRFALCMRAHGGELVLGGGALPRARDAYQWTPLIDQDGGYYSVTLEAIEVGDVRVPLLADALAVGGVVIDSGSSAVLLPHGTYTKFADAWRAECLKVAAGARQYRVQCMQISRRGCLDVGEKLLARLPPVRLRFGGGAVLSLSGPQYLQPDLFCEDRPWIFDPGPDTTGHIIGAAGLMPFHNVFDRANMRFGFAPLRDDSCALSSS